MDITEEDIEVCQKAFNGLDEDNIGAIRLSDFKQALESIKYHPGEYLLNKMISELDEKNTGYIHFNQFIKVYHQHKLANSDYDDQDTIDAFVAMGGREDKEGSIDATELIKIVKEEFQMSIDIEKLIQEIDEDGSGEIEFGEFKTLLKSNNMNEQM